MPVGEILGVRPRARARPFQRVGVDRVESAPSSSSARLGVDRSRVHLRAKVLAFNTGTADAEADAPRRFHESSHVCYSIETEEESAAQRATGLDALGGYDLEG